MELLNTVFANLSIGIHEAVTLANLGYCFIGVFLGCLVGVLPGLGSLIAISLLLPITYHLPASGALIMLAGVYFGADYGGGTCSILLGVPGHAAAAVDVLDGYPMSRQGRGGVALFMKCVASFWGSAVGIVLLMLFAPVLAEAALQFGPAEYASLMLLGLMAASTVGQGSPVKGVGMMVIGLILGVVGTDVNSGVVRFGFGLPALTDGVSLIALAMGVFAITEVIKGAGSERVSTVKMKFGLRDQLPTREDWRRSIAPMLRGSGLGACFGALPGTSGGMATFLAYAIEKRVSKHPEQFGKGAIEGIAAPEACNNAGVGTAFIPTLTLGIPGDAIMALMLAALVIHGIQPGPQVMTSHPDLFWGLIVSFWIGNLLLVILNIPLIGIWVRLLQIPYPLLYPGIVLFTCIGVYSTQSSTFDIWVLLFFGVAGAAMLALRLEAVPLLLGLILGSPFEENLRRSLLLSRGDFMIFVERPISASALGVAAFLLLLSLRAQWRARIRAREQAA
ncbi:MAG: tripartite tricarboxylate transporter permease [Burkholderiales bacterium]|nr:tripartite tricarboxylate transporter permease [Burkholderiales bacterium]MDE1925567.1 tripartite tricarboxylate transporter permease [Burkholderiales bacterium]MDE2157931.1 tripartite tricarboxylate transporter permease [Burkholderiales bacterium]MDE2503272.1 tripartite tricarboxylate transporter permease [Burkholderiales bacterium]